MKKFAEFLKGLGELKDADLSAVSADASDEPSKPRLEKRIIVVAREFDRHYQRLYSSMEILKKHFPKHQATFKEVESVLNMFIQKIFIEPHTIAVKLYDEDLSADDLTLFAEKANSLPKRTDINRLLKGSAHHLGFTKLAIANSEEELETFQNEYMYIQYAGVITNSEARAELKTCRNQILETLFNIKKIAKEIDRTYKTRRSGVITKAEILSQQKAKEEERAKKAKTPKKVKPAVVEIVEMADKAELEIEASTEEILAQLVDAFRAYETQFQNTSEALQEKILEKFEWQADLFEKFREKAYTAHEFITMTDQLDYESADEDGKDYLRQLIPRLCNVFKNNLESKSALEMLNYTIGQLKTESAQRGNIGYVASCNELITTVDGLLKANEALKDPRHRMFAAQQQALIPAREENIEDDESLDLSGIELASSVEESEEEEFIAIPPIVKLKEEIKNFRAEIAYRLENVESSYARRSMNAEDLKYAKSRIIGDIKKKISEVDHKRAEFDSSSDLAAVDSLRATLENYKTEITTEFDKIIKEREAHEAKINEIIIRKSTLLQKMWQSIKDFFKKHWDNFLRSNRMDKQSVARRIHNRKARKLQRELYKKQFGTNPPKKRKGNKNNGKAPIDLRDLMPDTDKLKNMFQKTGNGFTKFGRDMKMANKQAAKFATTFQETGRQFRNLGR